MSISGSLSIPLTWRDEGLGGRVCRGSNRHICEMLVIKVLRMKFDLEGLFITLSDRSLISKELLPFARIGIKNFKVAMEMESDDSFKLNTSLDSLSVTDIRKTCEWLRESEDDEPLRVSYFPDCVEGAVVAQVSKDAEGHMMVEATLETLTVVLVMDFLISFEHFFGIPIQKTLDNNKSLLASISTPSFLPSFFLFSEALYFSMFFFFFFLFCFFNKIEENQPKNTKKKGSSSIPAELTTSLKILLKKTRAMIILDCRQVTFFFVFFHLNLFILFFPFYTASIRCDLPWIRANFGHHGGKRQAESSSNSRHTWGRGGAATQP